MGVFLVVVVVVVVIVVVIVVVVVVVVFAVVTIFLVFLVYAALGLWVQRRLWVCRPSAPELRICAAPFLSTYSISLMVAI